MTNQPVPFMVANDRGIPHGETLMKDSSKTVLIAAVAFAATIVVLFLVYTFVL